MVMNSAVGLRFLKHNRNETKNLARPIMLKEAKRAITVLTVPD